jgi:hypothetical protein
MFPRHHPKLLCLAFAVGGFGGACNKPELPRADRTERSDEPVVIAPRAPIRPLDPDFLMRGVLSLKKQLGGDLHLLEVQAVPFGISLQLERSGKIVEYIYEESDNPADPGKVRGPLEAAVEGQGELERNLFRLDELDFDGLGKSFEVARKSVDPEDGKVERLVVRRFFPFGDGVRARVYVYSPRMPGSIDANPSGVPLLRR